MSKLRTLSLACAVTASAPLAHAAVAWDEAASGDLSNLGTSPTAIALVSGSNQILGATGNLGSGTDKDYFTLTIAPGFSLTSLVVLPVTAPDSLAFIGIQSGNQVTATTAAGLIGWKHYGAFDAGTDILPAIGQGAGASGFTAPLGAGTYSFWVQDFDSGTSPYGFELNVTSAVPEPASAISLLAGLVGLGWWRRRR